MPSNADIVRDAWNELYPSQQMIFTPVLKYSGRFKGLNGNICISNNVLTVRLSRQWRAVDRSIQQGMVAELIRKLKGGESTMSIGLYRAFLKHAHIAVEKTRTDPVLAEAFNRLNSAHFAGLLERPNLVWSDGRSTLGSYNYGSDTLSISRLLAPHQRLLDYVMYHEMLHKKHKFKDSGSRTLHHSSAFRSDERAFPDSTILEQELARIVRQPKGLLSTLRAILR